MRKLLSNALFIAIALLLCINAYSQKKTVTGNVVDSTGTPIPNVSVHLKSGRGGTTTKDDGSFTISASPSDVLVFSNIGFTSQDVRVADNANFRVVLRSRNQELNQVVVTALGIRRSKNSLPYATQQITGADITKTPTTNFVDNLAGKVAGLTITSTNTMGGSNNVVLRGMKSLTQSNQALFVVDGVPYDNTNTSTTGATGSYDMGNAVSDINPNDIESMSVLKGAAASALYGSRGSNGVILITTKKGSRLNKGLGVVVDFGVTTGIVDNSTMPTYQTQYGEGGGSAGAAQTGNPNPYFYWQPASFSNGQNIQIVQTDVDQSTGPAYDPNLKVYQWNAFAPGDPNFGKATPWQMAPYHKANDYFVTPLTNSTSVFVDGGGDKGTFNMGYTRSNDKGYLPNSNLLKNLLDFGATYNLAPNLTASGEVNFAEEQAIGRYGFGYGGNGTQMNPMTDFRQWWQTGINLHEMKDDYFKTMENITWNWSPTTAYLQNGPAGVTVPAFHDNPYWVRYQNFESDSRDRYFGYAMLNWKATSYLNFMGRVSRDNWSQLIETRYNVGSWGTPAYSRANYGYTETNYDFMANLDKNIGEDFNVKALLGINVRQDLNTTISAVTNGGLVVPGLYALSNSVNTPNAPTEVSSDREVDGIFAGATLSWRDMVTLDGTIRRDKSSTLPVANNAYYYPAVSANWVFSKLLPASTWLSYGKLRANYAAVGGDAPVFSLQNTYQAGTPFQGQTIFYAQNTNNNVNLRPESNHTYEFGGELSFLHSRLGLDVTYYHAQEINQILPVTTSSATGYSKFFVNGGTIQNSGVELTLNATPLKSRDFSWDIAVNWSTNKSLVVNLYGGQPSFLIASYQNSIQLVAEKGKSYGIIRGSDYVFRKDDGSTDTLGIGKRLINAKGDPVKSSNKTEDIGNINPKWMGGINNSFHYKNFSLSFLIDIKQGGQLYSLDQDYGASAGLTPHTGGYNKNGVGVRAPLSQGGGYLFSGVTADGKANTVLVDASDIANGKFPWSSFYGEAQRSYIYDASYIKLREVNFTWSMPARLLKGMSFCKGLDLSLSGRNLWIIHKNLPDADPEQGVATQGSYGGNGSMGFQSGPYPVFRTFGFNVKVKF